MEPIKLLEAVEQEQDRRTVFRVLLIMAAVLFMFLPFVTTFNEFLTRIVETLGLDRLLADWVVPSETRLVAVMLGFLGIPTQVTTTTLYLDRGGLFLPVYISWNCVGWQSFILFAATLFTGMQGRFSRSSKVETVIIGLLGTFLVNLLRITSVAVIAFYFGQMPAILYHDYGGTIVILLWLFGFWWFSHGWLLRPLDSLPIAGEPAQALRDLYSAAEQHTPLLSKLAFWRD
jgi:exosortase/archaeosortase family protein